MRMLFLLIFFFTSITCQWNCSDIPKNESNVCSGHGDCVAQDNCSCDSGYFGNQCDQWNCFSILKNESNVCNSHGVCIAPNNCSCDSGYFDNECDQWNCFGVAQDENGVCSGFGVCVAPNNCSCETNYAVEKDCSFWTCFGIGNNETGVCFGHGICFAIDNCTCDENWIGEECTICQTPKNTTKTIYYHFVGDPSPLADDSDVGPLEPLICTGTCVPGTLIGTFGLNTPIPTLELFPGSTARVTPSTKLTSISEEYSIEISLGWILGSEHAGLILVVPIGPIIIPISDITVGLWKIKLFADIKAGPLSLGSFVGSILIEIYCQVLHTGVILHPIGDYLLYSFEMDPYPTLPPNPPPPFLVPPLTTHSRFIHTEPIHIEIEQLVDRYFIYLNGREIFTEGLYKNISISPASDDLILSSPFIAPPLFHVFPLQFGVNNRSMLPQEREEWKNNILGFQRWSPWTCFDELARDEKHVCSGHGCCWFPDSCFCDDGWSGEDCSIPPICPNVTITELTCPLAEEIFGLLLFFIDTTCPNTTIGNITCPKPGICPNITCPECPIPEICPNVTNITCPIPEICPNVTNITCPIPEICPNVTNITCPIPPVCPNITNITCPIPPVCPNVTNITCPIPPVCPNITNITCPIPEICPNVTNITCPEPEICPNITCPIPEICPNITCPIPEICPNITCPEPIICPNITNNITQCPIIQNITFENCTLFKEANKTCHEELDQRNAELDECQIANETNFNNWQECESELIICQDNVTTIFQLLIEKILELEQCLNQTKILNATIIRLEKEIEDLLDQLNTLNNTCNQQISDLIEELELCIEQRDNCTLELQNCLNKLITCQDELLLCQAANETCHNFLNETRQELELCQETLENKNLLSFKPVINCSLMLCILIGFVSLFLLLCCTFCCCFIYRSRIREEKK